MICGSCGATIADKAIVCYRCGAPTATASPRPASRAPGGFPRAAAVLTAVAVALGGLAVFLGDESAGRLPAAAGSGIAVLTAAWSWFRTRR